MFEFDTSNVWEGIISVLLAIAGGLARLLSLKDNTRLQMSKILSELFISGFAGMMVLLLARSLEIHGDWLGLVCGMVGWIGPRLLDMIAKLAMKPMTIDLNDKDDSASH